SEAEGLCARSRSRHSRLKGTIRVRSRGPSLARRRSIFALDVAVGAPIPAGELAQLRNDDLDHLPRVALPIVVLARLQPAFNKQKLPGCNVLPHDFSQFVPAHAPKPLHVIILLTVTGFKRLIDRERETGHGLASRGEFQF